MKQQKTTNELRCFCGREPLLATYGVDENGQLYIHVKIFKQRRIFGEILITEGGKVSLHCRECLRWHVVRIRRQTAELVEDSDPAVLAKTS